MDDVEYGAEVLKAAEAARVMIDNGQHLRTMFDNGIEWVNIQARRVVRRHRRTFKLHERDPLVRELPLNKEAVIDERIQ